MPHHIFASPGDIARYCLTPGDFGRARAIADHFENRRQVQEHRGYLIFSGEYKGVFMTVCATGMGGPAVAIALEELAQLGADTFIRVGSCGVLQPYLGPGDVIAATGAVRYGGTANQYLPLHFPALPTFSVTQALMNAARALDHPVYPGLVVTSDSFYTPLENRELLVQAQVLGVEMETDTLFITGQLRHWRTGAIVTSDGHSQAIKPAEGQAAFRAGEAASIRIALEALCAIAISDQG